MGTYFKWELILGKIQNHFEDYQILAVTEERDKPTHGRVHREKNPYSNFKLLMVRVWFHINCG